MTPDKTDERTRCTQCRMVTMRLRGAVALADAVEKMIDLGMIDARSLAGDAWLDFRDECKRRASDD